MTGGMSLHKGGILMAPCPGLYHVYAQIALQGLDGSDHSRLRVAITLNKVCFNTTFPHVTILEKYVSPTAEGGFPFLAGTFHMTCDCGFALSTPAGVSLLKVTAYSRRSYFGAFLVDGALPGGSRR